MVARALQQPELKGFQQHPDARKRGFLACAFPGTALQRPWPCYAEVVFAHRPRAERVSLLSPDNVGQHHFSSDWQD